MSDKLNITSFNCKGFKTRNYDYLNSIFSKCDILLIQESWLYSFEIENVNKVLLDCSCFGVSAMNDNDICRQGRPHGGCLIIYKSNLALPIVQIQTISSRICAAKIVKDNTRLLLMSVYMPCDTNCNDTAQIYGEVLNEISTILTLYDDFDVVIGGDFNTDFDRPSLNLELLKTFIEIENLYCSQLLYNINDYTFESTEGSRSCIDHFICNHNLLNKVTNFEILDNACNLSDHKPLCISFECLGSILYNDIEDIIHTQVHNWSEVTEYQINGYKSCLDEFLKHIVVPQSVLNCSDFYCDIHSDDIVNYFESIIEVMIVAAELSIPTSASVNRKSGNKGKSKLPGWNRYVRENKASCIMWHCIWKDAGCPLDGLLADIRRSTRSKYHDSIKYIKRNKDNILKSQIAYSLKFKRYTEFWKEVRKLKASKGVVSSIIDNKVGISDILQLFQEKYESLYNEFDKFSNFDVLKSDIDKKCRYNKCNFAHSFNFELIKDCA